MVDNLRQHRSEHGLSVFKQILENPLELSRFAVSAIHLPYRTIVGQNKNPRMLREEDPGIKTEKQKS